MLADAELQPLGHDLVGWLQGQRFGEVRVIDAVSDVILDVDGYTALQLTVEVSDPRDETWPLDDVLALRDSVRAEARERDPSLMVYVNLKPETDDPEEDDENSER